VSLRQGAQRWAQTSAILVVRCDEKQWENGEAGPHVSRCTRGENHALEACERVMSTTVPKKFCEYKVRCDTGWRTPKSKCGHKTHTHTPQQEPCSCTNGVKMPYRPPPCVGERRQRMLTRLQKHREALKRSARAARSIGTALGPFYFVFDGLFVRF
jgi:hypothetical protein